jgi:N-acetylmuramoyl-L-alanine amidase
MKLKNKLSIAAITSIIFTTTFPIFPIQAQTGEEAIDQTQVTAIAVPGGRFYNLVVMEQIPGKQQCWQESGSKPTVIDPLWTTFDFTGSCRRGTDSNAYSVRIDGQDTSQDYSLEVVEEGNELQLVAVSRTDRSRTIVGKSFGKSDGKYLKLHLNPGWKFSKKTFEGKALGHFFFSGDTKAIAAGGDNPPAPPEVATSSFSDTATDTYQKEIEEAVALGFIAGFKDNTFKPEESLTREQLVSMVIGALGTVSDLQVQAPDAATNQPYPDVTTSRWSAAKIQWAKENEIVKGYPDGSFQPEKPVTRAELIAVLESAAKFANTKRGQTAELAQSQAPKTFSDTSGHWGEPLIQKMSGYCGVASAYNETGDSFFPNNPSGRNYAAAATLRMHHCIAQPNP